ncbi:MAG: fibro-slime domain-containing protein [Planctomycetota bacterium]|jgi:fibro-slime domain-containing protein
MRRKQVTTLTTYAVLGAAVVVSFLLPDSLMPATAQAQAGPAEIELTGLVRDFQSSHPDFNTTVPGGSGHFMGNVGFSLSPYGKPVFSSAGRKVTTEWLDSTGRPISGHLTDLGSDGGTNLGLRVNSHIWVANNQIVDSFDSSLGPYGGANVSAAVQVSSNSTDPGVIQLGLGSTIMGDVLVGPGGDPATVIENAGGTITGVTGTLAAPYPMPVLTPPSDAVVGPNLGDVELVTQTLSTNLHVNNLLIRHDSVVDVEGDVVIYCEDGMTVEQAGTIQLLPGASLTVYATTNVFLQNQAKLNINTADPTRMTLNLLGPGVIECMNSNLTYGTFIAPLGMMTVRNTSQVYGTFTGNALELYNANSGFHVDTNGAGASCLVVADTPGTVGAKDTGGITSTASFDQWFRDELGVNMSKPYTITLVNNGSDVYEYLNSGFYPIDGQLMGNEGDVRNNYFTYHIRARFVYQPCMRQFINLQGGDGMWLFVDGRLATDLGGLAPATEQFAELDRMGLIGGRTYDVDLFFAHRDAFSAVLRIWTNVELLGSDYPTVTSAFD